MVEVRFAKKFTVIFSKMKDNSLRERIMKQIKKISENPHVGKPMKNVRKVLENYMFLHSDYLTHMLRVVSFIF